ncbi:hypothetical protein SAMN04489732_13266, partial [Amycolatopsis saalfeldensis]
GLSVGFPQWLACLKPVQAGIACDDRTFRRRWTAVPEPVELFPVGEHDVPGDDFAPMHQPRLGKPEDRFPVSGFRFPVSGFRFPVSGFRFPVSKNLL